MKYVVVGASGFVFDIGLLYATKEYLGIRPWLALVITQCVVMAYNFTLNKLWSFGNRDMPHTQLVRYLTLAGINYAVGVIFMYLFNEILGIDYLLVRLGTVLLAVSWNFLVFKYWVYR